MMNMIHKNKSKNITLLIKRTKQLLSYIVYIWSGFHTQTHIHIHYNDLGLTIIENLEALNGQFVFVRISLAMLVYDSSTRKQTGDTQSYERTFDFYTA